MIANRCFIGKGIALRRNGWQRSVKLRRARDQRSENVRQVRPMIPVVGKSDETRRASVRLKAGVKDASSLTDVNMFPWHISHRGTTIVPHPA
jgi:hypothetical protein